MEPKSPDKVCYQFICPKYPGCVRARGKGCCIEYPDEETQMVQAGECRAEYGGMKEIFIFIQKRTW